MGHRDRRSLPNGVPHRTIEWGRSANSWEPAVPFAPSAADASRRVRASSGSHHGVGPRFALQPSPMLATMHSTRRLAAALLLGSVAFTAGCDDDDDDVVDPGANRAGVKVVHAIANAGAVSVLVDNTPVATNFTFPNVFPSVAGAADPLYASVDAGSRRLRVNLANGTTAIDQTATLAAGANYTVIAAGTAGGSGTLAPAYILLTDDVSAPSAGNIRLRAVHAASAVPAVDISVASGTTAPFTWTRAFQNVAFRQSGSATVPAGTYSVCVTLAGTAPNATGANCAILASTGAVAAGTVATAIARDPATGQTAPSLLLTVDRRP